MLEFDGATKRFGALAALDGCTFAARPGRLTGFLGPNGAGKTTAMRAVFGLVELDAGTVRWRGAPIATGRAGAVRLHAGGAGPVSRACGCATSSSTSASCAGARARDVGRSVDTWLERLGLADRASDRLDALSHGNQQRVQLIAALVNEPDLLVLDEPFSGLDPDRHRQPWPTCSPSSPPRARRCCSPATSSTWSRTCARTSSSSTTAGSCWPASWTSCGPRCRNGSSTSATAAPAPDWSAAGRRRRSSRSTDGHARLRVDRDTDLAAVVAAVRSTTDLVSFAYQPPTLSELFRQAVAA